MKSPLAIVAVLYAAGVIFGNYCSLRLEWVFGMAFVVALVALGYAKGRQSALVLLLPLVGWANLSSRTAALAPDDLRIVLGDRPVYLTVRGTLCEAPVYREYERNHRIVGHSTVELDVEALRREDGWHSASGRMAASVPAQLDDQFFGGRRVDVTGVVQAPKGPSAPGQFDYRAYLKYRGVFRQIRAQGKEDWRIVENASAPQAPSWCDQFSAWAQRTLARGLPVEDESLRLLWAMVLGWKPALTQEIAEPFMQSGTLHIFAISGLHIALISAILVSVLRVVRVPRAACGLVVIPLIWFYTLATGWQASAIRSTIMMTVIIVGWALKRPSDLVNSLAAAGIMILVWDPRQLFQAGFQLSFFVVLGLALLVPPVEKMRQRLLSPDPLLPPELRPRWKRWLDVPVRAVTMSLATSLAAWLGSMPLIAYYFYMVTPGSLLANMVIVPLSSLALMSSLGSLVCGDWFPFLTELFNHGSWLWMRLMVLLSEWFASLPGAYFYVRAPSFIEFVIYYGLVAGVLSGVFVLPRWRVWAGAAVGLVLAAWVAFWLANRSRVCLTVLPIQAGTVFVEMNRHGQDLLLDCGDEITAESMVKPFLRSQGVNWLPMLVLTHGDVHHVGGLDRVLSRFPARRVLTSGIRFRSPAYRNILAKLEGSPERWRRLQRGDRAGAWSVLHPAGEDKPSRAVDGALVLHGEIYGTRVLLLSKLGRWGQNKLLEREPECRADILIAGLPAPNEVLSDALLEAVKPRVLIVAGGEFPATARPSSQLRDRLARVGIPVIYTSDTGAATVLLRPGNAEVRTMDGRHMRLTP